MGPTAQAIIAPTRRTPLSAQRHHPAAVEGAVLTALENFGRPLRHRGGVCGGAVQPHLRLQGDHVPGGRRAAPATDPAAGGRLARRGGGHRRRPLRMAAPDAPAAGPPLPWHCRRGRNWPTPRDRITHLPGRFAAGLRRRRSEGQQLWLRNRSQLQATPIPGTDRSIEPAFSPDGQQIAFGTDGAGAIKVVTLTGAPPITVIDTAVGADGLTWSADGYLYYDGLTGGGTRGLMRVRPSGDSLER